MTYAASHLLKSTFPVFIFLLLIISVIPVQATIFLQDGTEIDESGLQALMNTPVQSDEKPAPVFFYDPECGACQPVHEYLEIFLAENPDAKIDAINIITGPDQMDRFKEHKELYNREKVYIPVIFFGPVALEGREDIENHFEDVYSWYMNQ